MNNRFNITEEEKNRIKGLHNINEQDTNELPIGSKYMGGYSEVGLPIVYENCVRAEDITDEQIKEMWEFYGSQAIEDNNEVSGYKSFFRTGRDVTAEDITDEQLEEFYSYVDGLLLKYKLETELRVPECRITPTIKQQEVGEQSRNLDKVKSTSSETSTDSESHEEFMTKLCGMDIVAMGDKMIGRRKCDGNTTDGSGGCYEPLIKLVKEYCKTK